LYVLIKITGLSGTSYSLWSATHSLKREHKRKFNRSLCGVLLGVSIVLVILGILGIIGIAVYLGGKKTHNIKLV
jgi:peptidoglycan biosynthesis protein MviN/MurJ (putative lipid II flippase)